MIYFVTGGARSGKSRFAEQLVARMAAPERICFVATGVVTDEEMRARIQRHKMTRDGRWSTIEEPHDVARLIQEQEHTYNVFLIDCLSLLLNNWMFDLNVDEPEFRRKLAELVHALTVVNADCVIVSNEIGLGLVPADALSRRYRDWLGWLNQAVAQVADKVYFVASGIAVDLKQLPGAQVVQEHFLED